MRDFVEEQGDVRHDILKLDCGVPAVCDMSVVPAARIIVVCVVVAQDFAPFGMVILESVEPPTGIARVGNGEHLDAAVRNRAIEFERVGSRHSSYLLWSITS